MTDDSDFQEDQERPSRSEQKRAAQALLVLAERLVALPRARLRRAELPTDLHDEIERTRATRSHGARKRQMRFLAGLLRRLDDAELEPLRALADGTQPGAQPGAQPGPKPGSERQRRAELLCQKLLEHGDSALAEVLEKHPQLDRQHLRSLLRQARREQGRAQPSPAARKLTALLQALPDG